MVYLTTEGPECHCPAAAPIQVPHTGLVPAWFYRQYRIWVLLQSPVLWGGHDHCPVGWLPWDTQGWQGKGVIRLEPGSLEADREGKKTSVWFVCLVRRTFRAWLWGKGNEYMTCSVTEWLFALWNGVSNAKHMSRGWEQGIPVTHTSAGHLEKCLLLMSADRFLSHPQNWCCYFTESSKRLTLYIYIYSDLMLVLPLLMPNIHWYQWSLIWLIK